MNSVEFHEFHGVPWNSEIAITNTNTKLIPKLQLELGLELESG